jgi:hypothetical protein
MVKLYHLTFKMRQLLNWRFGCSKLFTTHWWDYWDKISKSAEQSFPFYQITDLDSGQTAVLQPFFH